MLAMPTHAWPVMNRHTHGRALIQCHGPPCLRMTCCVFWLCAVIAAIVLALKVGKASEETGKSTCTGSLACLSPADCSDADTSDFSYSCDEDMICCVPKLAVKSGFNGTRSLKSLLPEDCGKGFIGNRIAGGFNAAPGQFPWAALLGYYYKGLNIPQYLCGGSLINDRYVLTAAHCVRIKPLVLSFVRLGELNIKTEIDCEKQQSGEEICADKPIDIKVEKIVLHPEFNASTLENDIALLRLASNVSHYTDYIQPICLPFHNQFKANDYPVKRRFEVAGWGKTASEDLGGSNVLQFASMNGLESAACNRRLPPQVKRVTARQLCVVGAGIEEACRGDSGGPLMDHTTLDGDVRNFVVGVVSYKSIGTCGSEQSPNVFTRVDQYHDWLLQSIEP